MATSRATKLAQPEAPFDDGAPSSSGARPGPRPALAGAAAAPVASQARILQNQLADAFDPIPAPSEGAASDKWPPAATLGFILATCGTFWVAAGYLAVRLIG